MVQTFFATSSKGTEPILAEEIREILGGAGAAAASVKETKGGVSFEGDLEAGYRVCLWSRIANRVLLPLKTFSAPNVDKLYAGVRSVHWTDHLDADQTLAVDFSMSAKAQIEGLNHTHFGALKVKDAICDQFRAVHGSRPSVDPHRPDLRINLHLQDTEATVSIDLSGESLHRRGYREEGAKAPLKENLAATILRIAGWQNHARQGGAFIDPMCGSGTLPIEAAMVATDRAPGLVRDFWGFQGWQNHVPAMWKRVLAEAGDRFKAGLAAKTGPIIGYDADFRAVRVAITNTERAELRKKVHIEKRELSTLEPPAGAKAGIVVINPPYGERLGDVDELRPLHRQMGDLFKQRFKGWEGYVFTGSPELSKEIGLKASRRFVLMNGPIECRLLKFELY